MFERIKKLVSLQDDLYIEPKNKIEIYQDKRNNELHLEDPSYLRKQKTIEYDGPEIWKFAKITDLCYNKRNMSQTVYV